MNWTRFSLLFSSNKHGLKQYYKRQNSTVSDRISADTPTIVDIILWYKYPNKNQRMDGYMRVVLANNKLWDIKTRNGGLKIGIYHIDVTTRECIIDSEYASL